MTCVSRTREAKDEGEEDIPPLAAQKSRRAIQRKNARVNDRLAKAAIHPETSFGYGFGTTSSGSGLDTSKYHSDTIGLGSSGETTSTGYVSNTISTGSSLRTSEHQSGTTRLGSDLDTLSGLGPSTTGTAAPKVLRALQRKVAKVNKWQARSAHYFFGEKNILISIQSQCIEGW